MQIFLSLSVGSACPFPLTSALSHFHPADRAAPPPPADRRRHERLTLQEGSSRTHRCVPRTHAGRCTGAAGTRRCCRCVAHCRCCCQRASASALHPHRPHLLRTALSDQRTQPRTDERPTHCDAQRPSAAPTAAAASLFSAHCLHSLSALNSLFVSVCALSLLVCSDELDQLCAPGPDADGVAARSQSGSDGRVPRVAGTSAAVRG